MKEKIKKYIKPFLNWKFLISFGIAWSITNGWCYVFIIIGTYFKITWMLTVGAGYLAFLWMPFTPEKLVTIPIAMWLQTVLFKKDEKLRQSLQEMHEQAKKDFETFKNKFKKKK